LLRVAAVVAPPGIEIALYEGLADLPHFNPDLDGDSVPPAVAALRRCVNEADAIVFSVPEYAHGLPGSLKNALDWLVGGTEFMNKRVALFNASSRGTYAQGQLTETLTVMTGRLDAEACLTFELSGKPQSPEQIAADPAISSALRRALTALAAAPLTAGPGAA
jgi:NAD(P)H-dependent FMN reductase